MNRIEKLEQAVKLILAIDENSNNLQEFRDPDPSPYPPGYSPSDFSPVAMAHRQGGGRPKPETVKLGPKTRQQLQEALDEPAWASILWLMKTLRKFSGEIRPASDGE